MARLSRPWGQTKPPVGYGLNPNDPINRRLEVCLPFHERAGASSIELVSGKLIKTLGTSIRWGAGKFGAIRILDGSTNYFNVGKRPRLFGSVTVSGWSNGGATNQTQAFCGFRGVGGLLFFHRIVGSTQGQFTGFGIADVLSGSNYNLQDSAWHFYSVSSSSATTRFYRDGKFHSSGVGCGSNTSGDDLYVGCWSNEGATTNFSSNGVDVIRIHRRILKDSEHERIYQDAFAGIEEQRIWTPAAAGGLSIPIAAYHYNHHLGSMAS